MNRAPTVMVGARSLRGSGQAGLQEVLVEVLQVPHGQLADLGDHDPSTDRTPLLVHAALAVDAVVHLVTAYLAALGDQEGTRREDDAAHLLDGLEVGPADECSSGDQVGDDFLLGSHQASVGHPLGQLTEQQHGLDQRVLLHSTQRNFSFVFKLQFYRSGWLWT